MKYNGRRQEVKKRMLRGYQLWIEDVSHGLFQDLVAISDYLEEEATEYSLDELTSIMIESVYVEKKVKS